MARKPHPLHNITAAEIRRASEMVTRIVHRKEGPSYPIRFKHIALQEPPKALLLPYLDAENAGVPIAARPFVPRLVSVVYHRVDDAREAGEIIVSLDSEIEVGWSGPGKGQHAAFDWDELRYVAAKVLSHPLVVEAVKNLQLPEDFVIQCDTWPYGADKFSTAETHKYIQAMVYARAPHNHPESNQYAFPIPISPVYDLFEDQLARLDTLATGGGEDGLKHNTAPPAALAHCVENEYHPDILKILPRKDLKPLQVVQPEGPSFKIADENLLHWQKWRFRVGFNYREGVTLHDVRYDGRKIFYRLSLSEMTVPYGDPRAPYHRKQAFDLGDAGAGSCANNLGLGCDCLGAIKYFGAWLNDSKGEPSAAPNVICVHEQDSGIGWKHTNHRTGMAAITRARTLVVQSIITVGNYEYLFAWLFQQSGTIEFETRATGILSTALIDPGKRSPWGNVVAPGVLAQNHQHLFCLRIDPMLDGNLNTVIQEDSIPIPESEEENPFANAWKLVKTPFEKSGHADAAPDKARVFKIINENRLNRISGNPVGFKLVPLPSQLILAGKTSMTRRRARFTEHHLWVTRYRDGDLWAGGKWTNQSMEEVDGVADYAARNEDVRNQDIVVWHTFGMTHNPRVEDFPVMPAEVINVSLKPADFFEFNPALDVPQSTQSFNKSVLVQEKPFGMMVETKGDSCCAKQWKL